MTFKKPKMSPVLGLVVASLILLLSIWSDSPVSGHLLVAMSIIILIIIFSKSQKPIYHESNK